jgi:hypothetical protein
MLSSAFFKMGALPVCFDVFAGADFFAWDIPIKAAIISRQVKVNFCMVSIKN